MAEEPLPQRLCPLQPTVYGKTQGKDGSSPPLTPYCSGGSSSISKGRWHALVAGSTGVITAASRPLVSVPLSWVLPQWRGGRGMDSWVLACRGPTLTCSGFILPTDVAKFTLKQFLSEKCMVLGCYYCCLESHLKQPPEMENQRGASTHTASVHSPCKNQKQRAKVKRGLLGWPDFLKSPGTSPQLQDWGLMRQ